METIANTTSCRHCGRQVEDAMHLMLCDGCLDRRLAQLERAPAPAVWAAAFAALERRTAIAVG